MIQAQINTKIIGTATVLLIGCWHIYGWIRLVFFEREILKLTEKYHDMEKIMHKKRGAISQPVLDGVTKKAREPVRKNIELLKLRRRFLLDKLPLLGFFKSA